MNTKEIDYLIAASWDKGWRAGLMVGIAITAIANLAVIILIV